MRIKVNGGFLDVEVENELENVRNILKKIATQDNEEATKKVREAGEKTSKVSPHSSKSNQQDKLNAKQRMPI